MKQAQILNIKKSRLTVFMTGTCYQKRTGTRPRRREAIIPVFTNMFPYFKPRNEYIRQVAKNMTFVRKYNFSLQND